MGKSLKKNPKGVHSALSTSCFFLTENTVILRVKLVFIYIGEHKRFFPKYILVYGTNVCSSIRLILRIKNATELRASEQLLKESFIVKMIAYFPLLGFAKAMPLSPL